MPHIETPQPPAPSEDVVSDDLAKTQKRTSAPRSKQSDGPPDIPSFSELDTARTRKQTKRRRGRKGKRRTVKIPDDNVPATPTPAAVTQAQESNQTASDGDNAHAVGASDFGATIKLDSEQ